MDVPKDHGVAGNGTELLERGEQRFEVRRSDRGAGLGNGSMAVEGDGVSFPLATPLEGEIDGGSGGVHVGMRGLGEAAGNGEPDEELLKQVVGCVFVKGQSGQQRVQGAPFPVKDVKDESSRVDRMVSTEVMRAGAAAQRVK